MKNFSEMYKTFFEAMVLGGDIKRVVNAAYEYFKRPITVIDVTYRLLCQLPDDFVSDIVFDSLLKNKGMPEDTVLFLEEGKYRSYLEKNPQSSFVNWGNLKYPRIMGAIKSGGNIAGYFAVLYKDDDYKDEDLIVAEMLRQALGAVMQRKNFYSVKNDDLSYSLMRALINGTLNTNVSVWSKYCPNITKGGFLILNAKKIDDLMGTSLKYICRRIEEKFDNCIATVQDNSMYILFFDLGESKKQISFRKKTIDRVTKFLESNDIICGLSDVFFDIDKFSDYKLMAQEALKIGSQISQSQRIFKFKNYAFIV